MSRYMICKVSVILTIITGKRGKRGILAPKTSAKMTNKKP